MKLVDISRRGERVSLVVKKRFFHLIDMADVIFVLEKYFIIRPVEMKKILGKLPIMKHCGPPWR